MRRTIRVAVPLALATLTVVGLGSSLDPPQPVSHATVSPPSSTAAEPTLAAVALRRTSATTAATVAPPTVAPTTPAHPQPAKTAAPPVPLTDQWHSVFTAMAAELPGTYVIRDTGAFGNTDLQTAVVSIAPRTPVSKLADVMRHESMHVRQFSVYGTAKAAYNALIPFGGWEAVADCGAIMLGATWTYYVKTCTANMNHAARAILNGVPA